ncbi:acetyl-CoA carboxylase carboxyltransferase subunit alpha [Goodfellowiella coeruleoviolacea]|uniref:Multifunctional fusion protein n=1 Tax=Goodfellowiella coeruleoviolacea TaxID=334858 RepID=A0AAE3KMD9_9PSEU|nr:acetyl-CoA carboxylase carboxyltransferase subunit alpha [Goodfellowiella coeruleoviolacea]MCP2167483.1 acetyl-CoA carboxylase carboxyl transferase subunit beta [Goodfellowiella coeruleoviolacea]
MTPVDTTEVVRWIRCAGCQTLQYAKKLDRNLRVCPECGTYQRLTAQERLTQLTDADSFVPLAETVRSVDALGFTDSEPYPERLTAAQAATGMADAVLAGTATIGGVPVAVAVMDFRFMGGSLGAAVGEAITRTAETALRQRTPLLIVTASGGARMQEGCLSLMQMAKTSQAIGRMRAAGLLSISLLTDPTYGGVAASFATNCDVVVAESGARMGFAGPRVIEQTIRQRLPEDFQTAEFLLAHGQVDAVRDRRELKPWLEALLRAVTPDPARPEPSTPDILVRDPGQLGQDDAWQVVATARDVNRPTTLDYVARVFDSFVELHGDRAFGDCPAVIAGLARFDGHPIAVIGHQKGHTTKELVARNFGMPKPEGYRKALRVMRLAARLGVPIVTFVDTPGAYPGIDAEERGQSAAIAENIVEMTALPTPVITVVTGEGGSGGALALAVSDRVLLLANAVYSVISPEGCSAILWGDPAAAPEAARRLRITARELLTLGVVDAVVPEPDGGTQHDPTRAAGLVAAALRESLAELRPRDTAELVETRRQRFRSFGITQCTGFDGRPRGEVA